MATAPGRICLSCDTRTDDAACPGCGGVTLRLAGIHGMDVDLVGRRIGQAYDVTGVLGRGGMGVVYRGVQLSMDRPVAIKVIAPTGSDPVPVLKRFAREARITSRLQHPNTIRVYDSGVTEEGLMYLVMELLEGRELGREIKTLGRLPLSRASRIASDVLRALHEAHGLGIVHRDLKPANIFLQHVPGGDVTVKVMDFGIAKWAAGDRESSGVTRAGQVVGSPAYMSPEQVQGSNTDARTDLYALGIIFFEMLAGRPPFTGDSVTAVMLKQVTEPPPDIGVLVEELQGNAVVKDVLSRLLAKDPAARPQTASDAVAQLERLAVESTAGFRNLGPVATPHHAAGPQQGLPPGADATDPDANPVQHAEATEAETDDARTAQPGVTPQPVQAIPVVGGGRTASLVGGVLTGLVVAGVLAAGWQATRTTRTVEPPVLPAAPQGHVRITTSPVGALVSVDGVVLGPAPVTLDGAARGTRVKATRQGYVDKELVLVGGETALELVLDAVDAPEAVETSVPSSAAAGDKRPTRRKKAKMSDRQLLEDL